MPPFQQGVKMFFPPSPKWPSNSEWKKMNQSVSVLCKYWDIFPGKKKLNGFKNMYKNVNTHHVLECILTFCFPRQLLLAWKVEWTFYLLFCQPIFGFVEHWLSIFLLLHKSTLACTWNKTKEQKILRKKHCLNMDMRDF